MAKLLTRKSDYINTNPKTLQHFMTQKHIKERHAKWFNCIIEYMVEIQYQKGIKNFIADALSRLPSLQTEPIISFNRVITAANENNLKN